jgi:hypothetical protein
MRPALLSRIRAHYELFVLVAVSMGSTMALYVPFALGMHSVASVPLRETGFSVIQRNWDGPLYAIVSQTFYASHSPLFDAWTGWPIINYPAFLPGYPFVIRLFSTAFFISPLSAMLIANIVLSAAAVCVFYIFTKTYGLVHDPFVSSLLFLFFPPRWFMFRSIGASEPLFILATICMLYAVRRDAPWYAILFAVVATLTRIWGVLTIVVLLVIWAWDKKLTVKRAVGTLAIPLALLGLFSYYAYSLGDFFAYFKVNANLLATPFSSIARYGNGVSGEWYAVLFVMYALGIILLYERGHRDLFVYSLLLFVPVVFIVHPDVSRYLLVLAPFALIIGLDAVVPKRRWHAYLLVGILVIAAYVYCFKVLPENLMQLGGFQNVARALTGAG